MEDSENPYKVLGVSEDASASQIKSAYRKLALKHHPDRQADDASKQMATQIFAKISNAYEILGDESRRHEYDIQRQNEASAASGFHYHQHFHDPFQVFAQVFGEEFGTAPRSRGAFGSDPFFNDPFFSDPFGRMGGGLFGNAFGGNRGFGDPFFGGGQGDLQGGGGDLFSSMNRQMEMMRQQQMELMRQSQQQQSNRNGGGFSSFYSSSSSSTGNFGGNGNRESVTTTTRMINGKRQTVTERVVHKPDGTTERHVETTGDDDFPAGQLPPSASPWLENQNQRRLPSSQRSRNSRY